VKKFQFALGKKLLFLGVSETIFSGNKNLRKDTVTIKWRKKTTLDGAVALPKTFVAFS
jgi:hypothetical protein